MRIAAVFAAALLGATCLADAEHVQAAIQHYQLNIPRQSLDAALKDLAQQTGLQIGRFSERIDGDALVGPVEGTQTPAEALKLLLLNTGLDYKIVGGTMFAIYNPKAVNKTDKMNGKSPSGRNSPRCSGIASSKVDSATSPDQAGSGSTDIGRTGSEGASDCASGDSQRNRRFASAEAGQASKPVQGSDRDSNLNMESTRETALAEVIVTATKQEQNARDVPISLSAMSEESLQRSGATSFQGYLETMPGVSYNAAGTGRSMIILRGISTASYTNENTQSPTALYIDDLPTLNLWSAWTNTDLRTFDAERVEVLRGPQGTLFGSGSLGGAVRVITNKPNFTKTTARTEIGFGSTKQGASSTSFEGMFNTPLIDNQLALRAVAYKVHEGGYIDNVVRGDKNTNETDSVGGRLVLGYHPTELLSIRASANYQHDEVGDAAFTFLRRADGPKYAYNGVLPAKSDTRSRIFNITAEYDFGPTLLTSSTTYASRDSYLVLDRARFMDFFLGTGLDPGDYDEFITHDQKSFAQELRFSSQGKGRLRWVAGAFFLDQNVDVMQIWNAKQYPELFLNSVYLADPRETALFGEATYQVTDWVALTLGARAFRNEFAFEVPVYDGYFPTLVGAVATPYAKKRESAITPRFAITVKASDDVNLYGTISRGYRVGQINFGTGVGAQDPISGEVIPLTFDPDTLWNYELGMKAKLLDDRMNLNVAAFFVDWSDIQIGRDTASGLNYTDNAGNAESKGVELELQAAVNRAIEVGLSATYTDAKLTKVKPGVPFVPGTMLPGTPDWAVSDYLQYSTAPTAHELSFYARLSHRYVGKQISDMFEPESLAPSQKYHVLDVRAGMYFGRYELVAYVDNLANNRDAISVQYPAPLDDTETTYRLRPRTVGVTLRANFE